MKEEMGARRENPCKSKDGTLALLRKAQTLLAMRWLQIHQIGRISSYFSSEGRKYDSISKFCNVSNVTTQINEQ